MIKALLICCAALISCGPCEEPTPAYCGDPPYSQLNGPNYWPWINSDCTGERARGALSQGLPCAQWPDGEVFCVDMSTPIDRIYFHDPNQGGACVEYLEYYEPWYTWRSCGIVPFVIVE